MLVRATADLDEFRDVLLGDLDISNIEVKGEENSEQITKVNNDKEVEDVKNSQNEVLAPICNLCAKESKDKNFLKYKYFHKVINLKISALKYLGKRKF